VADRGETASATGRAESGAAGQVAGLLLAAGAGRRFGGPKALVELDGEPLVRRAVRTLGEAGCAPVRVVVGAAADDVRALLSEPEAAVYAEGWESGMGASLRAGLTVLASLPVEIGAVLVHLVDLPWVPAQALARVAAGASAESVRRAAYGGVPGHPVVFGRRWWSEIATSAQGDRGARDWLRGRTDVELVECGDLGSGQDVDRPADLRRMPETPG
jgi:CTP:molybdopterin cytidylyltransferase MocA